MAKVDTSALSGLQRTLGNVVLQVGKVTWRWASSWPLIPGLAATPTPRPTDGVDVYFGMPGEISEHEGFLRAKMDLEERRMRQINEVMIPGPHDPPQHRAP